MTRGLPLGQDGGLDHGLRFKCAPVRFCTFRGCIGSEIFLSYHWVEKVEKKGMLKLLLYQGELCNDIQGVHSEHGPPQKNVLQKYQIQWRNELALQSMTHA